MFDTLMVRWTVRPSTAPRPWLLCSTCHQRKAFQSSGRFRLNANGTRLDAWLIYKCRDCEATWNRPIFERQPARSIDRAMIEALQANEPALASRIAFDLATLRRHAERIEEGDDVVVTKQCLVKPQDWQAVSIEIDAPLPTALRLDRLLAAELPVSRSGLTVLAEADQLRIEPLGLDALRRRLRHGTRLILGPTLPGEREAWHRAVTGAAS